AVGLALVHFLWQGAVIGAAAAALFWAFRRRSAETRYLVGCVALAAMTAAVLVTFAGYARDLQSISAPPQVEAVTSRPPWIAAPLLPLRPAPTAATSWFGTAAAWAEARWPIVLLVWCAGVLVLSLHLLRGWLL